MSKLVKVVNDLVYVIDTTGYREPTDNDMIMLEEQNEQRAKNELRLIRKPLLLAFDKWEKAVLRGREIDDSSVLEWYENILNLVASAFEDENIPARIKYYM